MYQMLFDSAKDLSIRHASLLAAILLVSSAASTNTCTAQRWSGGIRIGTSITTLRGSADTNFGYSAALAGGGSVSYWFTETVSLRGEVMYAQRGGTTDNAVVEGNPSGLTADVAITYIDLPLLVVARLPIEASVVPSVFAGGAYGSNIETLITLRNENGILSTNSDDSIAGSDLFGIFGAGLDFDVLGQTMVVDARAALGLKNVRPDRDDSPLKNTSFIVTVGLDF